MADEWLASLIRGVIDFASTIIGVFVSVLKIFIKVLGEVLRGISK